MPGYPSGPDVITRVLNSGSRKQKSQVRVRGWERDSTGHAGFEDGAGGGGVVGGFARCQGMRVVSRSWKRQGTDSLPECPEGTQPCQDLHFSPVRPVFDS